MPCDLWVRADDGVGCGVGVGGAELDKDVKEEHEVDEAVEEEEDVDVFGCYKAGEELIWGVSWESEAKVRERSKKPTRLRTASRCWSTQATEW